MKRLFDIVVALCVLILLSPVILLVYVLVKIKLGSPVFFMQQRPGLNGENFSMNKFRTMKDIFDENRQHAPDAVRLTSFGKTLRAASLDELPGLWNGSMSNWNTLFVELPSTVFSPVKSILDLTKDSHLG